MKGTDKNTWASGMRPWTGRFGPVLLVLLLLIVPVTAQAAQAAALHRAVKAGNLDGLARVLAAGVDVNTRDSRGWTALMYAVDKGYLLLVEPLLAAQADPNVRRPDGSTALFIAAVRGQSEIIAMLMKAGADPTIKGMKAKTATEVARMRYGDTQTALKQGEPPAVIALLAGKTWAEGADLARELRERQPGRTFRDCEQCPEMVVVPAGNYMMGSPDGEKSRVNDEGPVHEVTIAAPLAVGKYEVTFAEWDACVAAGGCTHQPRDVGWGRGKRPVIDVSWDDAQEYVQWLSREVGKPYRLLSEAEWEYVARAGTTTPFHTGETISPAQANYNGNYTYGSGRKGAYKEKTVPVGSYAANGFGVYDVHGNVEEWVADCWHDSYRGAPSDGSAWESGECSRRVVRGGSWNYDPENLRSAGRLRYGAGYRFDDIGFRLARTLTP